MMNFITSIIFNTRNNFSNNKRSVKLWLFLSYFNYFFILKQSNHNEHNEIFKDLITVHKILLKIFDFSFKRKD